MNFSSRVFLFVGIRPIGPGRFADYTPIGAAATFFVKTNAEPDAGLTRAPDLMAHWADKVSQWLAADNERGAA